MLPNILIHNVCESPQARYNIQRSQWAVKLWKIIFLEVLKCFWKSQWMGLKDILQCTWIYQSHLLWRLSRQKLHPSCSRGCGKRLSIPGWKSVQASDRLVQQGIYLLAKAPPCPAQPVSGLFYKAEVGSKAILFSDPGLCLTHDRGGLKNEKLFHLGVCP